MTRRDISTTALIEAYASGMNMAQIARQFNCDKNLVRYRLVSSGAHKPTNANSAKHGTRTMYVHHGCRCEACCRAEHEQYLKRKDAQKRRRVYSKWGDTERAHATEQSRKYNIKRTIAINSRPKAHGGHIRWMEIAEKYEMKCAICGGKVNPNDKWVNETGCMCFGREYPTVDHIIPLDKGGTDTFDNVQLAHKRCNSKKGTRLELIA